MMIKNFANTLKFLKNAAAYSYSEECYALGDFQRIHVPMQKIYLVNDASVLHHILIKSEANYTKSKIYWQQLKHIIGDAMGSMEGDEWLTLRKLQNPYFQKTKIQTYLSAIISTAQEYYRNLPSHFNVYEQTALFNVGVILKHIFGIEDDYDAYRIFKSIENGEELIAWQSKFPWRKHIAFINKRKSIANESLNFLSTWTHNTLSNKDREQEDLTNTLIDNGYNEQHIRNEYIIHLGAGTETVAVANSWTMYLLLTHPEYLEDVYKEIMAVTNGNDLKVEHLNQLEKLEAGIMESLRLYPPSHALVRDAVGPDEIKNTKVNAGDSFYISVLGIHRNPKYWDNPNQFIPERFTNKSHNSDFSHTYIPFGAGKHSCIGKYLALPLMKISLATIIMNYEMELISSMNVSPLSLSTLKPDQDIIIKLNPRL